VRALDGGQALADTEETPAKAVERLRAEVARLRVAGGAEPIEAIARQVGFTDPERMRCAFLLSFGQPPPGMRRAPVPRRDDPAELYVNVRRRGKIAYSRKLADSSPSRLHNGGKLYRAVNVSAPAWPVSW
jgi:AraC-like DNA-binding protein